MNIIITDSGLGGLSIAAELYKQLKFKKIVGYNIIFANALPEANQGYNKMKNTMDKVSIFNKALFGFEIFSPKIVAVACNTLSVITPKTEYYQKNKNKIIEIIDSGINGLLHEIGSISDYYTIILGTETTIQSNVYYNSLINRGLNREKIINQSCGSLASEIEKNYKSKQTEEIVKQSIQEAVSTIPNKNLKIYLYLGCTHYGNVENIFLEQLQKLGFINVEIYNPNNKMVSDLLNKIVDNKSTESQDHLSFEIISKAEILPEEIISISELLKNDYPVIVSKLVSYRRIKDLF